MNLDEHICHLESEANRLADAVGTSDLEATVVTCPDWSARDLTRHVGQLYRWSSKIVAEQVRAEIWPFQVAVDDPADGDWAGWLRAELDRAIPVFRKADPSLRIWSWGADPHARFWPRRMLYETVVHRLDLAITNGQPLDLSPEIAVEGIDEWLENLKSVGRWQIAVTKIVGDNRVLSFAADDTGDTWRIRLFPTGWFWDRDATRGEVHVTGSATDLLVLLQGRGSRAATKADGDEALLGEWLSATAF